jgi:hypothetical protein
MADKPPFEQGLIGTALAGKYRLVEARGALSYRIGMIRYHAAPSSGARPGGCRPRLLAAAPAGLQRRPGW